MVQSVIEASLNESEDNNIEIDIGIALVRPRPVSKANKRAVKAILFEATNEDMIRTFETIYGSPTYDKAKKVQVVLEQRKLLYAI